MSETYELQPDEKYDFIRRNKKTISFNGYNNHVHIDPTARTMTIDVDDNYEFVEEGNEYKRLKNFDTPEQRLLDSIFYPQLFDDDGKRIATPENENGYRFFPIVSHEDITKKYNGDYVYNDVFRLNAQYSEDDMTLFNPFAGLLITFPIGEGLLDYCFSFFACDPQDLLDSALETLEYNNISKDITTPKARNKDELRDLECEYMRRSIVALDPYMYRSLYSSIFPPELEEISETSLKYYIFYLNELKREMRNRINKLQALKRKRELTDCEKDELCIITECVLHLHTVQGVPYNRATSLIILFHTCRVLSVRQCIFWYLEQALSRD